MLYSDAARILKSLVDDQSIEHPEDSFWVMEYGMLNLANRFQDLGTELLKKAVSRVKYGRIPAQLALELVRLWIRFSRELIYEYGPVSFSKGGKSWFFGFPTGPEDMPTETSSIASWPADFFSPLLDAADEIEAFKEELKNG